MGIEYSDCLLMEINHRHNYKISLKRYSNFPSISHYDTWMVDQLQILMEYNHSVCLFPNWSNSLDYIDTNESFRTIILHAETLKNFLDNQKINYHKVKLILNHKYIAKYMGTKIIFLPICAKEE